MKARISAAVTFLAVALPPAIQGQEAWCRVAGNECDSASVSFRRKPEGWLGVYLSLDIRVDRDKNGKEIWVFKTYPFIEAVEPRSPAYRAGVEAGDLLLAVAGKDLRGGIEPLTLLRPGTKLPIRVKRDDETVNLTLTVQRRPDRAFSYRIETPEATEIDSRPEIAVPPAPRQPMIAPMPPLPGVRWSSNSESGVILGAEVRILGELKDYFGVNEGVLVLHVDPRTPAARSGLKDGDVIVNVDGRAVTTVRGLMRSLEGAEDRSIELQVVRKKERKTVTLKW
ncbi:MAG: PDZ domain-containing protein [Gemmatimonadaceae bacterium]